MKPHRPSFRVFEQKPSDRGLSRIRDVLPQLITRFGLHTNRNMETLIAAWKTAVGAPYCDVTHVEGCSRGTLKISVPHTAFVQELSFRHDELLAAVRQNAPAEKMNKIKFVVGT
ncbi:MAG: DUF721 domain-containing protein [Thermoguttaceae bacterium]